MAALKTMSVTQLQDLRDKVDTAIGEKVRARRQELEAELSELERHSQGGRRGRSGGRDGTRGPVAPKYRNPENPAETWSGRGLKPRWMAAAIKGGKKLEDFAIEGVSLPRRAKATRTPRKK